MQGRSALGGPILGGSRRLTLPVALLLVTLAVVSIGSPARASQHAIASCPTLPYVNGFDVNRFAGTIAWSSVTCEDFVYARATDGLVTDTMFSANRSGASSIKLPFGASDYFEAQENAVTQADNFLSVYRIRPGDLPPVLDLETTDGVAASTILTEIASWLSTVKAAIGVVPVIYTYPAFWSSTLGDPSTFTSYPLWIANYGVSSPTVPASNWGGHGWTLWQYSGSGTVTGVPAPGATDLDYFSGSNLATLRTSATSSVSIVSYTPSPVAGESLQVAVRVSGAFTAPEVPAPSGAVTVSIGKRTCTAPISGTGGIATGSCAIAVGSAGQSVLLASYPGDSNWHPSTTSTGIDVKVGRASSTTSLGLSKASITFGSEGGERLSVKVLPQYPGVSPTGSVTIKTASGTLCKAKLSSGKASCKLSSKQLPKGTYKVTATYGGNKNLKSSKSSTTSLTVVK